MADMIPNKVSVQLNADLVAGQQLQIRVLNADGSVSSVLYTGSVPSGNVCAGVVNFTGILS